MIIPAGLANGSAVRWPLVSVLPPLSALTTAPASARAHIGAVLPGWHLADLTDVCQAVVSELVTNALEASTGPTGELIYVDGRMPLIRLRLLSDGVRLIIEVWDHQAPGFPVPRRAASGDESGRGLHLVDALTGGRWGWQPVGLAAGARTGQDGVGGTDRRVSRPRARQRTGITLRLD